VKLLKLQERGTNIRRGKGERRRGKERCGEVKPGSSLGGGEEKCV